MKSTIKKMLALMLCLAMVFCFAACGGSDDAGDQGTTGDGSLQAVLDRGVLRVGAEGNWSPYVYNEADGTLVGFEVEMAAAIAEKLGVTVQEEPSDSWDGVMAGLDADRYDVIICGASPNPDRQAAYEVTQAYGEQLIGLVVAADNEEIKDWTDLEGKISANSLTSSSGNIARSYGAELVQASLEEAMMLIRDGRADCQVNDVASINAYIAANPDCGVKVACYYQPENAYEIQSAAIIKKGNVELRDAIDQAISELIADGTAYDLCVKYFGEDFANNVSIYK